MISWFSVHRLTILLCLCPVIFAAQADSITFNLRPQPEQTVHLKMTQELDFQLSFETAAASSVAGLGPMKMSGRTVFAMTQKTGKPNDKGQLSAELTWDEAVAELTLDGSPMPSGGQANRIIGKKMTAIWEPDGTLADLKLPDDPGMPADTIKQMIKGLMGLVPKKPLTIGETITTPFEMALPVPGAGQMKFDGSNKYKLVAVEKDGADRLARFENTLDGRVKSSSEINTPQGKVMMTVEMTVSGGGPLLMNVDRNFVKSSETQATLNATIKMTGDSTDLKLTLPTYKIQGTMKVKLSGSN